jgi:hypothetical protein
MKTKIVTSYYPFHHGEPYWGQLNRDRWYKYSLATICGLGTDVVCYTDPGDKGYEQLLEIKEKFNLENLTIKIYNIETNPYQDQVYKIRMDKADLYNNPENMGFYIRPTVIYWMKYSFLEMEYEPNSHLYWIDSGLSHSGLFPSSANQYNNEPEFATSYGIEYMANEYKVYNYNKAFTPEVLDKINTYAEDKIINLYRHVSDDNLSEFNRKLNLNTDYESIYPIAGIFGGNSDLMIKYINKSKEVIEQILQTNEICTEQEIMAYINATNRDWFKNWYFDTFYHEDWTNIFSPEQVSFSHFFLKSLT